MTEEKYGDSYGEKFRQCEDKIKELEKQLTKAKELLKSALDKIDCVEHYSWWDKAEKFLAEE